MRRMRHLKAREIQGCDIAYDFSRQSTLFDATSGGSAVAADGEILRAEDVSGNGNHATQGTVNLKPLRKVAARNGLDVARFDGSNDYMIAGDVADMLAKPVVVFAVSKRSSGTGGYIFGKSHSGSTAGRWSLGTESSKMSMLVHASSNSSAYETTGNTNWNVYTGYNNRAAGTNAAQVLLRKNATQAGAGAAHTDALSSYDTGHYVFVGAYQNAAGTGPAAGYYLNGDIGETSKYSVAFTGYMLRRVEHALARKWGIAT